YSAKLMIIPPNSGGIPPTFTMIPPNRYFPAYLGQSIPQNFNSIGQTKILTPLKGIRMIH
ncbi:MAG: hypothetical protein ACJ8MO_33040, partial [Bacillus sp. (in: firmicutes)]